MGFLRHSRRCGRYLRGLRRTCRGGRCRTYGLQQRYITQLSGGAVGRIFENRLGDLDAFWSIRDIHGWNMYLKNKKIRFLQNILCTRIIARQVHDLPNGSTICQVLTLQFSSTTFCFGLGLLKDTFGAAGGRTAVALFHLFWVRTVGDLTPATPTLQQTFKKLKQLLFLRLGFED